MCLVGVVVRRYIDFLILLIPTPLASALFCSSIPASCSFFKMFFILSSIYSIPKSNLHIINILYITVCKSFHHKNTYYLYGI